MMNETIQEPLRYAALFTGVGGFELGIQRAIPNAECVFANEWDKHACTTYRKNFPKHPLNPGDIRAINASELPNFDLLVGGFPCQTFSIAGKRKGFEDTRGTMFFEIARILEAKKPRLVLLENVKGLLNHDQGQTFRVILEALGELGYDVQWMVLNSKFFGVPQNRERVFIIGCLRGESRPEILPFGESNSEIKIGNSQDCSNTLTATYWKGPGSGKPFVISHAPRCGDPKKGGTGTLSSQEHSFAIDSSPHYVAGTLRTHKDGEGFRELQEEGIAPCIPARAREDGSGQPVIAFMMQQTAMKRSFETPKEINEFLREHKGEYTNKELASLLELPVTQIEHYFRTDGSRAIPSKDVWFKLKELLKLPDTYDREVCDFYEKEVEFEQTRRVYDSEALSPTLNTIEAPAIAVLTPDRPEKRQNGRRFKDDDEEMFTLNTQDKHGVFNGTAIRRLTPVECERLQGFPDNWTQGVSDTQRYKQMGNAVTVNVIEALIKKLLT